MNALTLPDRGRFFVNMRQRQRLHSPENGSIEGMPGRESPAFRRKHPVLESVAAADVPVAQTPGWVADASWTNAGTPIQKFSTTWIVPPAPRLPDAGQWVYLFIGMEPTADGPIARLPERVGKIQTPVLVNKRPDRPGYFFKANMAIDVDLRAFKFTHALFADTNPCAGEASLKTAQNLGLTKLNARDGDDDDNDVSLVFPGTALEPEENAPHWPDDKIQASALALFAARGGINQIKHNFPFA